MSCGLRAHDQGYWASLSRVEGLRWAPDVDISNVLVTPQSVGTVEGDLHQSRATTNRTRDRVSGHMEDVGSFG
jgi:hypothetical protein